MDQNIKQQWIAALRSGEYQQGAQFLRDCNNKFCCLGVLCDLVEPDAWAPPGDEIWWRHNSIDYEFPGDELLTRVGIPDLGLGVSVDSPRSPRLLAEMNDEGATFAEIADYIETNL